MGWIDPTALASMRFDAVLPFPLVSLGDWFIVVLVLSAVALALNRGGTIGQRKRDRAMTPLQRRPAGGTAVLSRHHGQYVHAGKG